MFHSKSRQQAVLLDINLQYVLFYRLFGHFRSQALFEPDIANRASVTYELTCNKNSLSTSLYFIDISILKNGHSSDVSLKRESPLQLDPPLTKRNRDS